MGTNYYTVKNFCKCCNRSDQEHIGKQSMGWSFTFQATPTIRDFDQWLASVKEAELITDEYGRIVSMDELLTTIENHRSGKSHVKCAHLSPYQPEPETEWEDQYGNSFVMSDFS